MTKAEKGFLEAYDKYADSLFRHCYFRLYDKELAKDFVQETFCKAWDYIGKGNEVQNLRALLYRIATNLIIDHSRSHKPTSSLELLSEQGFEIPTAGDEKIIQDIEIHVLYEHLAKLDEDHRSLIHLRFIEGYKPKEIAEIMNESPNVISVRLHRAIKVLKNIASQSHD